jgi:hypothetical protein
VRAFSISVPSTRASIGGQRVHASSIVAGIIALDMKNIVILISGGGSNMAAIVRAAQRDNWRKPYGAGSRR